MTPAKTMVIHIIRCPEYLSPLFTSAVLQTSIMFLQNLDTEACPTNLDTLPANLVTAPSNHDTPPQNTLTHTLKSDDE
jgi:hypothetical protein